MVASIEEQRAGLRDTLSLLDSLLANAPIGFAFFDRASRFVRVNDFFASLTGLSIGSHLGRTPTEVLQADVAAQFDKALEQISPRRSPFPTWNSAVPSLTTSSPGPGWSALIRCAPCRNRFAGLALLFAT